VTLPIRSLPPGAEIKDREVDFAKKRLQSNGLGVTTDGQSIVFPSSSSSNGLR
jgi:hypothetical protein